MAESRISIVFPGQGSQRTGMGQDFYEQFPLAKEIFDKSSEAIGEDLKKICFEEDPRINLTEFTQPSILVTEMAIYSVLEKEFGIKGEFFAGHSLGEYTALCAIGVLDIYDAAKIVKKRGALMQQAVPEGKGAMSALILKDIETTDYQKIVLESGAEFANFNSSEQTVISGKKESVEKAGIELKKKFPEMNVVPLTVSAPFHSSLMKEIESEFRDFLKQFSFKKEKSNMVLSNFTGVFHEPESLIDNLVNQISGSVNWLKNMKSLIAKETKIYEVGPNRPLGKFFGLLGVEVPSVINVRSAQKLK